MHKKFFERIGETSKYSPIPFTFCNSTFNFASIVALFPFLLLRGGFLTLLIPCINIYLDTRYTYFLDDNISAKRYYSRRPTLLPKNFPLAAGGNGTADFLPSEHNLIETQNPALCSIQEFCMVTYAAMYS